VKEYHKILTVFERDPETNHKTVIEGRWAAPEFEYLQNLNWTFTEKVDGTNIRVIWDGASLSLGGKTNNAQIPAHLVNHLRETFTVGKLIASFEPDSQVCLYGEGYGKGIQKGGIYLPDRCGFILFDVKVGDVWLERHNVEDIAGKLGIPVVPIIGDGPLMDAISGVKAGFPSLVSEQKNPPIAEGLVCRPSVELFNRMGHRVITKIKHKDFITG
jgi:hypothetical protein